MLNRPAVRDISGVVGVTAAALGFDCPDRDLVNCRIKHQQAAVAV